ncbi:MULTISPECIES: cbb3-type cytochrome c oxidase subunit 3 [Ahrensia]|uniref:Cbb3-type cytochrome c oxidase subunit 3 n=1 Tax=Ahrensia kielensis TaxID=76980 RepID=A0ABU9T2A6_9HYPH|nr:MULTISPECIES: cbb3-type cytochrome c oxidase subunit 3 [Ahrensia]
MELSYQTMRTFADSWGLLYMFIIFCFVVFWTFRPSSKPMNDDAAQIPFKEDN